MSFLRCHNCDWVQDAFWSVGDYRPLRPESMKELSTMLTVAIDNPSKRMVRSYGYTFCKKHFGTSDEIDVRQLVVWELKRIIRKVENMHWMTHEDFKNDSDKRCPNCGSAKLDID